MYLSLSLTLPYENDVRRGRKVEKALALFKQLLFLAT